MAQTKFRSLPLRESPSRVDRENRVIYGVSAAQAVEALGHGMMLDGKTLQQIVDLGNRAKSGVKSRFTHPGLSSDGMGKHLGRMKNFRVEGDKAVGDLYLADIASKAPDGDLASYVMDLAEEDSAAFGMSVVIGVDQVWPMADGTEQPVYEYDDDFNYIPPKGALTELPVARAKSLDAVDVVDEPAANRDGMFSAALRGTNQLAENMFGNFDGLLAEVGMTPQQAWGYALKYFDARGVDLKKVGMEQEQNAVAPVAEEEPVTLYDADVVEESQGDEEVTQEEAKELQAKLSAFEQREKDALAKTAALAETIATMQKEARSAHFQKLATGWQGEIAAHLTVLEALGEGSEAYGVYCRQQSALSEQISTGKLFEELGRNSQTSANATAAERLDTEAKQIAASEKISYAQAVEQAAKRNPELYKQYVAEMRGN